MCECDHDTPAVPSLPPHRSPACSECSGHSSYHDTEAIKAPGDITIKKIQRVLSCEHFLFVCFIITATFCTFEISAVGLMPSLRWSQHSEVPLLRLNMQSPNKQNTHTS